LKMLGNRQKDDPQNACVTQKCYTVQVAKPR